MKTTRFLFFLFSMLLIEASLCNAEQSIDPQLAKKIATEWEEKITLARASLERLDADPKTDTTNPFYASQRSEYTMPGFALRQLEVCMALLAKPQLTVTSEIDKENADVLKNDQQMVILAKKVFIVAKLEEFLSQNPDYGSGELDVYNRDYIQEALKNAK